jgi:hypothetical protein
MPNVLSLWEIQVQIIVKDLHQMQQLRLLAERDYVQILVQQTIKLVMMECHHLKIKQEKIFMYFVFMMV